MHVVVFLYLNVRVLSSDYENVLSISAFIFMDVQKAPIIKLQSLNESEKSHFHCTSWFPFLTAFRRIILLVFTSTEAF